MFSKLINLFTGGEKGSHIAQTLHNFTKVRRKRREVLKFAALSVGVYALSFFVKSTASAKSRFLRPPGALDEEDFLAKCIRCGLCGDVCPNQCINFHDIGSGKDSGTPFITPRIQGCMLCMKCNNVCPSGALQPLTDDIQTIRDDVKMGVAVLDTNLCYSYNQRICGVCYRACPLQDEAITIGDWEAPTIHPEKCIGCGLCERICYHYPQAIRITPQKDIQNTKKI